MSTTVPEPNIRDGIDYWNMRPATYDGVLGGFGTETALPRIDALGSRQFLIHVIPSLSTVPSAVRPLLPMAQTRTRALDVGAGVGRVTADVLLHLVSDVVLLEPIEKFVREAWRRALSHVNTGDTETSLECSEWKGLRDGSKSVTFLQGTLQQFDPARPTSSPSTILHGRLGYIPLMDDDTESGFDVIWCQWCLGHLSDPDLLAFLKLSHSALRRREDGKSVIVVKENVCQETEDGRPTAIFDEEDSSLTRSDLAWKGLFKEARLRLVKEQVQRGLPGGLFVVKMYALR